MDLPPVPLSHVSVNYKRWRGEHKYVSTGEITTLKHERWDHTVEFRTLVSETLLASAEGTEVLNGSRDFIFVEIELDTTGLICDCFSQDRLDGCCFNAR